MTRICTHLRLDFLLSLQYSHKSGVVNLKWYKKNNNTICTVKIKVKDLHYVAKSDVFLGT